MLNIAIAPKPIKIVEPKKPPRGKYDDWLDALAKAFADGDNFEVNTLLLKTLEAIEHDNRTPSPVVNAEIGRAIHVVLTVFCSPRTVVLEGNTFGFLWFNTTIANAIATQCDQTTDTWLATLAGQHQEAFKTAVLMSPKNVGQIRMDDLFRANPALASSWFCETYKTAFAGNVDEHTRETLIQLSRALDDRFLPVRDLQEPYFLCTYLGDEVAEQNVKKRINDSIRKHAKTIRPGKISNRIAVVSDYWLKGHSVHRTLSGYIDALRGKYKLDLIHAIRDADSLETAGFDNVIRLNYDGSNLKMDELHDRGYCAVIYPDVGMTGWSILLANHRIAPVQVMMTGHPVSTFGSEIDYFISGELTEGEDHEPYSEKHVRLPGFGAIHERPTYEPKGRNTSFDGVVINASWYGQKIAHLWCRVVDSVIRESGVKCKIQLFAGGAVTSRGGFAQFLRSIGKAMPSCEVEVYPHLEYGEYMHRLEQADFAVDCFPFAGSNTMSDNLWLRKPVVCLAGRRWFNSIGPAMLNACGLGELACGSIDKFRAMFRTMLVNAGFRDAMSERLQLCDLDNAIYRHDGAEEFRAWMDDVTAESRSSSGSA